MSGRGALYLVLPGDPRTLTGGYLYDARMARALRARGWQVVVRVLEGTYPKPTARDVARAEAVLAAIPSRTRVVVDGLALGVLPEIARRHAGRLRLSALVHHPLAAETGLDAATRWRLFAAERRALCVVARVIVTSARTAASLRAYGVTRARIAVAPPGTDPAPLAPGSEGGCPGLLCVGTLTPRKGHEVLMKALAGLRHLPWRLDCVGSLLRDPRTADEVQALTVRLGLGDRVRFTGDVAPARLGAFYARADLFVLASYMEGYGMALAEALARGLPVVSTTAGAVPATVPSGAGLLVRPGHVQALRRALERVLTDAPLRERLRRGATRARANLQDWQAAGARFALALR